jgi:hypothetical protein
MSERHLFFAVETCFFQKTGRWKKSCPSRAHGRFWWFRLSESSIHHLRTRPPGPYLYIQLGQTDTCDMRITHEESGTVYEITEQKGSFTLTDSSSERSYSFKESYEALWCAIELIRNSSFDKLKEDDLKEISKYAQVSLSSIPKSLIAMLKREKINRTYYDQTFLKLLSSYRIAIKTVVISNKTNFIVYHELAHLVRGFTGTKLSIPAVRN